MRYNDKLLQVLKNHATVKVTALKKETSSKRHLSMLILIKNRRYLHVNNHNSKLATNKPVTALSENYQMKTKNRYHGITNTMGKAKSILPND